MPDTATELTESREQLIHALYEAAELEHNLICTYLYACFSLKSGVEEGLTPPEAEAVARWRRAILDVAIDEMGHLTAVWNITAALGGTPRFGRGNFPLDIGYLPAGIVVKLAPFDKEVLQHFIHLERPGDSDEPEGKGFEPEREFKRGSPLKLTPMALDYATVGVFYDKLGDSLRGFANRLGEKAAFAGDPSLQMGAEEIDLKGAKPVLCLKTALQAFDAIVTEGEGASAAAESCHYNTFRKIRDEYATLAAANPNFRPAWPAAVNPVLRRPPSPEGKVWIEDPEAKATVDLANASYQLMLRLLGYSYSIRRPHPEKGLAVDLAVSLMRAVTLLGERAARLPAGPDNPHCHAGMSFTALRDAAPFAQGDAARRFFLERFEEFSRAAAQLGQNGDPRASSAARIIAQLLDKARTGFTAAAEATALQPEAPKKTRLPIGQEPASKVDGIETVEGDDVTVIFEGRKCIHSRFCVTWTPSVFLANVEGPWIHPNTMDVEKVVEVAELCPSGAIRYKRKDGKPDETAPPVNLAAIRERGPYALRGEMLIDGKPFLRATLCRCGASKRKPFCDGSHSDIGFDATGEPDTVKDKTAALEVRNGPLHIDPQVDGPLRVRGNLEITAGTGRMVARVKSAVLCRCGHSASKPFCDGSHTRVGFKSANPER